jgi:hypothetical protein
VEAIVREEEIAAQDARFIAVNAAIADGPGAVAAALVSAG